MTNFPKISKFDLNSANKTTWIFGAGASTEKPYNVPLQGQLLKSFLNLSRPGGKKSQQNLKILKNKIKEYCHYIQPGLSTEDTTLEEVFSAYELELKSMSSSIEDKEYANKAISALREAIIATTQAYGPGKAKKFNPHKRNNVSSAYAEFLEKIFPLGCPDEKIKAHSLVTMNYDINLDRCLINLLNPNQGEIFLDYGIDFADYRLRESFTRPEKRAVLLLRLHGGLNWIRCQICQSVFTTINSHATVVKNNKCKMCGCEKLAYVMVHPSYIRNYTDPILKIVWGRLKEELINSDRWIFIGYSLPTADVDLRVLVRKALRIRKERDQSTDIIWVGYRVQSNSTGWIQQGVNYYSVFAEDVRAWNALGGFTDFIKAMN